SHLWRLTLPRWHAAYTSTDAACNQTVRVSINDGGKTDTPMNDGVLRICLWSGPRNVSTALMYSFAQRADTRVFDEPLYAHYLARTPARAYHPGAEEVLAAMDHDGERVVREVILQQPTADVGGVEPKVLFFKHMTHHLVGLDLGFLEHTVNVLLTRDPRAMLASYARAVASPTLDDVGYRQ